MQLRIQRSQRKGGIFGGKIFFMLDVRVEYTAEEKNDINKYNLGGEVLYTSEAARRQLEAANQKMDAGGIGGFAGAIGSLALARLKLTITIVSLQQGHHIECKDLAEMMGAEQAILTACKNLRDYLKLAASFNGTELVIDFSQEEPTVVPARQVELIAPEARIGITASRS